MRRLLGNFPLLRLTSFPNTPLGRAELTDLRARSAEQH
jgi:hypothetical protein